MSHMEYPCTTVAESLFGPYQVAWDTDSGLGDWPGLPPLWFCTHWLAMSHSCLNPLIYYWMNARFRACYRVALARLPGGRRCRCLPASRHGAHAAHATHATATASTWTTVQLASYPPRTATLRTHKHYDSDAGSAAAML